MLPSPTLATQTLQQYIREEYFKERKLYCSDHRNKWNWWIHAICVPIEWLSWLLFLSLFRIHNLTTAFIIAYYVVLPTSRKYIAIVGHGILTFAVSCFHGAKQMWYTTVVQVFLLQVAAWSMQIFVGHYIFEKNQPSMASRLTFNSIILSVLLAWEFQTSD